MLTGKKNLFIAALEVVSVGIFLKIGYHLGNKFIERVDGPKKKKKPSASGVDGGGGRKRVVEDFTGTKLTYY